MLSKRSRKFRVAQTTSELAIFGTILIFILGIILRQAVGFSYSQNMSLKATRMAMKMSYEHSSGIVSPGGGGDGDASRNSASVLLIEDRLTASSAKYGAIDRSPQIAAGSATHSRNLLMPVESGESWNMAVMDVYINGKYFAFTTARLVTVDLTGVLNVYKKIYNGSADGLYDPGAPDIPAFDLNRNGVLDPEEPQPGPLRLKFKWQWQAVPVSSLAIGDFVDVDGDLKLERVVSVPEGVINSVGVQDYQEGDLDFTQNTYDFDVEGEAKIGLTNDAQVFTFTKTPTDPLATGTYLRIEEGRLIDGSNQLVRSVQRKDQIDMISRAIRLAKQTATGTNTTFCSIGGGLQNTSAQGMAVNPVEACGSCLSANYDITCMGTDAEGYPSIWVRSRILDRRGRKWITNTMADESFNFGS